MCGIVGFCSNKSAEPWSENLEAAVATLRLRGPDDKGTWLKGGVGLGHTRLSILDLSEHGHQPMLSKTGRYVMVFNGEVYNFRDIRDELSKLGHTFRGSGDSEVILAAFEEWGLTATSQFVGMFAIALWDQEDQKLILIRDRLGVKPLYYGWDGNTVWFGSELKALRAFKSWRPEINRDALSDYFRFGYINAPHSIYAKVYKLPPAHILEWDLTNDPAIVP